MSSELLSFLDQAEDLNPPPFDSELCWNEYAADAIDGQALTDSLREHREYARLQLVPAAEAADPPDPPARLSLRSHIEGVEAIAQAVEDLDPDELTDADRDELSAMLIGAIAGTKRKVDDTARVLAMFEHLQAAAKDECDRLDKRAKYYGRQAERLSEYVLATLDASGLDRLDGETSTLRRKKNPPRVVLVEGARIAEEWLVYPDPPAPHPDKDAIKRAIKSGREVAGASLAQTFRLVRS